MNEGFRLFPESASRGAVEVDYLSLTLLGITTLFSVGIAVAIVFFIVRYWHAREANRISSHSSLLHWVVELTWTIGPLLILLTVFCWGAAVYIRAHRPPDNPIEVYVVAKQWMWKVSHDGGRREINELHIPTGQPVRLTMISEDVIHSFFVPAFRIKQDVLPGRYATLWFEANRPGTYHLFCAEYCGTDHSRMTGKVIVQTPEEYAQWLDNEDSESLPQRGRRLVEAIGCLQCHGQIGGNQVGPPLTGLFGRTVTLADGSRVQADDTYIRSAILDPQSQRRTGFRTAMPSYDGQLEPEQIMAITAYIRSIADATGSLAAPGPSTTTQDITDDPTTDAEIDSP